MPTTETSSYVTEFDRFDEAHGAAAPSWLRAVRQKAIGRFTALGFPTTRQEEWRFTNVAPIAAQTFQLAVEGDEGLRREHLARYSLAGAPDGVEIVFVNGRLASHLAISGTPTPGVSVRSLAEVLAREPGRLAGHLGRYASYEDHAFAALNTAFLSDGALVEIAPNTVAGLVHVIFVAPASGQMSFPRVLVLAGTNSQVRLVESYVDVHHATAGRPAERAPVAGHPFTDAVTEIVLADGAVVDHYRVQRESPESFHMSSVHARLAHASVLSSHIFTFGGSIARNDVTAVLAGEGGDCTLNGLYLSDGSRLVDNHTVIDHAQSHCSSHEVFKGILGGHARGVFHGRIIVRPDAQKTDARQTNKTLLLSDDAQINTKPQLEIFANDVKCTHGATVGQLSADALFYLQARGIDRRTAEQMLVRAFAADITSRVKIDALRERLDEVLLEALHWVPAAGIRDTGARQGETEAA